MRAAFVTALCLISPLATEARIFIGRQPSASKKEHHVVAPEAEHKLQTSETFCSMACTEEAEDGGHDASSTCVTDCEAKLDNCLQKTAVDSVEHRQCKKDVLATYDKKRELHKKHTKPLKAKLVSSKEGPVMQGQCEDVCGSSVNSTCITQCEAEIYQCINSTVPEEVEAGQREACFEQVLEKYKKFKAEWDANHPYLVRHADQQARSKDHHELTAAERKAIHDQCEKWCSEGHRTASSTCVTDCETDMYQCRMSTLPNEMDERKECRQRAEEKYSTHHFF